jgi:hypothetical protein
MNYILLTTKYVSKSNRYKFVAKNFKSNFNIKRQLLG